MAARSLKPRHQDEVRDKIKASQLINRLFDHALGRLEKPMDKSQVSAALGLLKKVLPDLSATEHSGDIEHSYVARLPEVADTKEQWQRQHSPTMQ